MARVLLIILFVSLMLTAGTCQTFQYSRGWLNGKRSNNNNNNNNNINNPVDGQAGFQSEFKIAEFPVQAFGEYSSELSAPLISSSSSSSSSLPPSSTSTRCSLQKLRMMLQGNGNEELYLLPCEYLGGLQRSYQQQEQQQQRRWLHQ